MANKQIYIRLNTSNPEIRRAIKMRAAFQERTMSAIINDYLDKEFAEEAAIYKSGGITNYSKTTSPPPLPTSVKEADQSDIHHDRQADDLRTGLEVLERVAFCHTSKVRRREAGLNPSPFDSALLDEPDLFKRPARWGNPA